MNCELFEELLSSYLEGELPAKQNSNMQAHLKQCKNCLLLYKNTAAIIKNLPKLKKDIPLPLKNRLKMIPQSKTVETLKSNQLKWIAAIISTFALLLNLFYFTNINPAVNKILHEIVFSIEKITVKAAGLIEDIKDSGIFASSANENGGDINGYQ